MSTIKEEALVISGLATSPNEAGILPPGSLRVADNVVLRRPGVLEPLPAYSSSTYGTYSSRMTPRMFPGPSGEVLVVNGASPAAMNQAYWLDSGGFLPLGVGPTLTYGSTVRNIQFNPGQTQYAVQRNRSILTEAKSPIVMDDVVGAGRLAGIPGPSAVEWFANSTGHGPVIAPANYVKYTAVFFRDFADGYNFRGAPAPAIIVANGDVVDAAPNLKVWWNRGNTSLQPGDKIEIYRTAQGADPAALDDEFYLCGTQIIGPFDIPNGNSGVYIDICQEQGLGAALYTNQFQDGASQANYMPPTSNDVAAFNKATFYAARSTWAQLTLSVPGYFGASVFGATDPSTGVGQRTMTFTPIVGTPTAAITGAVQGGTVAGQELFGTNAALYYPAHTKIVSVVGATLTLNKNALSSPGPIAFFYADILTVNGKDVLLSDFKDAVPNMAKVDTGVNMIPSFPYRADTASPGNGVTFQLIDQIPDTSIFTVTGTNGNNYNPPLSNAKVTNDPRKNRVYYSRIQQPESVPPLNYLDVGSGSILRMLPTQSALIVFCTDGTYRITGDGDTWRVDPLDLTVLLLHPDAADTMDNTVYCWTSEGFTAVTDAGAVSLSAAIQQDVQTLWANQAAIGLPNNWGVSVSCDSFRKEVWLNISDARAFPSTPVQTYIYNVGTQAFTTTTANNIQAMTYVPRDLANAIATSTNVLVPLASPGVCSTANVAFNPLLGGQYGDLKQWMEMVLNWGAIQTAHMVFAPNWDGVNTINYTVSGTGTTVVPVPRHSAYGKQLKFGFLALNAGTGGYWQLVALSVRLRTAAETLKR